MKTKSRRLHLRQKGGVRAVRSTQRKLAPIGSVFADLRSILVPIDFSPPSEKALAYAVSLARKFGAKLTILNVVEPFPTPDFAYYPLVMENDRIIANARQRLEQVPAKFRIRSAILEKTLVRHGVPYREITDAARTLKTDLIVISTHGYSGLAHMFMGSTAERVVRHAECPVLVLPGRTVKASAHATERE